MKVGYYFKEEQCTDENLSKLIRFIFILFKQTWTSVSLQRYHFSYLPFLSCFLSFLLLQVVLCLWGVLIFNKYSRNFFFSNLESWMSRILLWISLQRNNKGNLSWISIFHYIHTEGIAQWIQREKSDFWINDSPSGRSFSKQVLYMYLPKSGRPCWYPTEENLQHVLNSTE